MEQTFITIHSEYNLGDRHLRQPHGVNHSDHTVLANPFCVL